MQSLLRRCLIETAPRTLVEKEGERFFLQPVVMEYATERLIQQVCRELEQSFVIGHSSSDSEHQRTHDKRPVTSLLQNHALIRAQAKEYVRETQKRLLVEPITEQLQFQCGKLQTLELQLKTLLEQQQQAPQPNYLAGNLLNLLVHLQSNLRGCDFSRLAVSRLTAS